MNRLNTAARQCLSALVMLVAGAQAMAYEEPRFEMVQSADDFEVRRYDRYIVAETDVTGSLRSAGGQAFRILAGYIFGNNSASETMNMTAPVETRPTGDGVKMAMTAPVISASSAGDTSVQTYAFVMERKYSMDTLPTPNNPRVRLRELPPRTVAVRRFGGFWSESNFADNAAALLKSLADAGIVVKGAPVIARYNGPLTPWFLRRNEVMVEVLWPPAEEVTAAAASR